VSFSFWSLDFVYYPVSGIMWVWHKVFGFMFGFDNPWAWVLSVVFLVFTLRAILFKPFMKQMDSQIKMQAVQPEMKKLREKYKDDRQRLTQEMMRLNKEAGVNPMASCLPALMQAPVFIGLYHVLRSFANYASNPVKGNNYFFPASDVESFLSAKLFGGAPLSAHVAASAQQLNDLGADRGTLIWVVVPLTILAGIATHLTSRKSVARQATMTTEAVTGQAAIMQKLMLYVFPLGVIVMGPFMPLAILFYWLSNNTWTFGQLWVAHRIQDRKNVEESKVVEAAKEETKFSTPRPGAKPVNPRRPVVQPSPRPGGEQDGDGAAEVAGVAAPGSNGSPPARAGTSAAAADGDGADELPPGMISDAGPRAPRPGARPPGSSTRKPGGNKPKKKKQGRR
jgi:YidC/Oxa1 family membrane protein insertase